MAEHKPEPPVSDEASSNKTEVFNPELHSELDIKPEAIPEVDAEGGNKENLKLCNKLSTLQGSTGRNFNLFLSTSCRISTESLSTSLSKIHTCYCLAPALEEATYRICFEMKLVYEEYRDVAFVSSVGR